MTHEHVWKPGTPGGRVIVALHGTGGDEHSLLELVSSLDSSAAILSPRGNVMEGSSPRFFRRLAEGVFDEADIIRRANDLADFIVASGGEYGFGLDQTCAIGYSNGANIAAALLLLRPEVFASAVLIRSMVPLQPQNEPNLIGKRVLMLSGDSDPILPVENAQKLEGMFRAYGADVTFELLRAGHSLTRRDLEIAAEWLG
ncbi:alpha/beta hydrolase [soil metagenome]